MIRPEMRDYSIFDLLFEFKFVPLSKLGKLIGRDIQAKSRDELVNLAPVQQALTEAHQGSKATVRFSAALNTAESTIC